MLTKRIKNILLLIVAISISGLAMGQNQIVGYQYWFDNNPGAAQSVSVKAGAVAKIKGNISTGSLSKGYHIVTLRFQDSKGNYSSPTTSLFNVSGGTITGYEYWFDDGINSAVDVTVPAGNMVNIGAGISTGSLTKGYHTVSIRFKDATGLYSAPQTFLFVVANANIIAYEYWFDFDYNSKVTNSITATQNLDLSTTIDISHLSTGTHYLLMHFEDALGNWSSNTIDTVAVVTGVAPVSPLNNLSLFPSLTSGHLQLKGTIDHAGKLDITVYNNLGIPVAEKTVEVSSELNQSFDFTSFSSGTYYMSIRQGADNTIRKFVKE